MSEIKSTLELVLEKTRHLTLSREEKQHQEENELRNKLRGHLRKYQDGAMKREEMERALRDLDTTGAIGNNPLWVREIVARIDLDRDNGLWLDLLKDGCKLPVDRIEAVIADYNKSLKVERLDRTREMVTELAAAGIEGSAVRPYVEGDPQFTDRRKALKSKYQLRLENAFSDITGDRTSPT